MISIGTNKRNEQGDSNRLGSYFLRDKNSFLTHYTIQIINGKDIFIGTFRNKMGLRAPNEQLKFSGNTWFLYAIATEPDAVACKLTSFNPCGLLKSNVVEDFPPSKYSCY